MVSDEITNLSDRSTVSSFQRSRAIPKVSKPGPMFALKEEERNERGLTWGSRHHGWKKRIDREIHIHDGERHRGGEMELSKWKA